MKRVLITYGDESTYTHDDVESVIHSFGDNEITLQFVDGNKVIVPFFQVKQFLIMEQK